jgi:2,5-diketo-D-gluconate reductase A
VSRLRSTSLARIGDPRVLRLRGSRYRIGDVAQAHDVPQTVTLPSGVEMPMVGLGTWQMTGREAYNATLHALQLGYRHIDTATMYRNESEVGQALRDSGVERTEVFLTTKLLPEHAGREHETITASLRALETDHVDLWLVHWPPHSEDARVRMWHELLARRDEGLAHTIGVSNFSIGQIDELADATGQMPAVNQVPWSPSEHDPRELDAHRERGVVLEGYSPLKRTRLDDPTLASISSTHGVSVAQVVLRWHLQHGIPVIPKSANPERLRTNFDLFSFELDEPEMERIDALAST